MSNDENTDLLLGLGLSLNQARVYLAILKLEKTTVGQAAKFSKVRREDVYRIMPSLEKMGLIERLMGKPTVIRATPISDALSFLVAEEKTKSDDRLTGMRTPLKLQQLCHRQYPKQMRGADKDLGHTRSSTDLRIVWHSCVHC